LQGGLAFIALRSGRSGLAAKPKAVKDMENNKDKIEFGHGLYEQTMAHEMRILIETTATIPCQQLQITDQVHHQEQD